MASRVLRDTFTPTLDALKRELGREGLLAAWASAFVEDAQKRALGKGGRNFWREVAQATRVARVTKRTALVVVDHVAGAQKERGGPIAAREARFLTIPLPGSPGRGFRAREIPGLRAVVDEAGNRGVLVDQSGTPLYVLVRRTRSQRPDRFLPTDEEAHELLEEIYDTLLEGLP